MLEWELLGRPHFNISEADMLSLLGPVWTVRSFAQLVPAEPR